MGVSVSAIAPLACANQFVRTATRNYSCCARNLTTLQGPAPNVHTDFTLQRTMASSIAAPEYVVGYVTAPATLAEPLARHLVESRVVACCNILPQVTSVYTWKGALETGHESLIVLKTRGELTQAVIAAVKAKHEYEVPEVIFTPITGGLPQYLDWIADSTRPQ